MSLLYTCIVALLGILFLLVVKRVEMKKGRQTFFGRFFSKGDPVIIAVGKRLQEIWDHRRERAFFLFLVHIPNRVEALFGRIKAKTHGYYHGTNPKMRGKRDFSNNTVSPYMRSMSFRRDGDTA